MYTGICTCLLLALLSISSFTEEASGLRDVNSDATDGNGDQNVRLARLTQHLLQTRRDTTRHVPVVRSQSFDPPPQPKGQDYLGWPDFGRRNAEEYENSF